MKERLKKIVKYMDDILFTLGVIFLSLGGFLLCLPIGFFILGVCCIAYAFIFAKFTGKARR